MCLLKYLALHGYVCVSIYNDKYGIISGSMWSHVIAIEILDCVCEVKVDRVIIGRKL